MGIKRTIGRLLQKTLDKSGREIRMKPDPYKLSVYNALYDAATLKRKPFYNVGAGSFWHPHWTNIDFVSDWYGAVQKDILPFDLMALEPLPIASDTAEIIYTSHTIEHIKEPAAANFFKESHRALRKGGIIRITCPDAETDFRAMQNGDKHWFYWDEMYTQPGSYEHLLRKPATSVPLEERWLHHLASALAPNDISPSAVKYEAPEIRKIVAEMGFEKAIEFFTSQCVFDPQRPGNHICCWTHTKVMDYLRAAGFTTIYRSGYGQSASPVMRNTVLFDSTHPQMALFVEAVK
jgi:SAM-dependent methyltransferase